jgi:hypothetical protein
MKRSYVLLGVGLILSGVTVDLAHATGATGPSSAMFINTASEGYSLQLVAAGQRYELERAGNMTDRFDSGFIAARIGYDYAPWGTAYGSVGAATADIGNNTLDDDGGLHWDVGTYINLWSQGIEEPRIIESTLGVIVHSQISGNYVSGNGGVDVAWHDWITSVALTITVPGALSRSGTMERTPDSATYYVGPAFSYVDVNVENVGVDYRSQSEFGLVAGGAINVTPQFTLLGEYRHINDEPGFLGVVAYKF